MPFRAKLLLAVVLLLGGLVAMRESCFRALGAFLVQAGEPAKADVAVVLAGDWRGLRVLRGGELVKAGYVPVALVDGPLAHYGMYECDLAIPFAVKQGYPETAFLRFPIQATSTDEEARLVVAELHRRGWKRFLLVTSNYHTRRAGRIFRKHIAGLDMTVVAAPDAAFSVNGWWKSREGRKTFAFEWMKTVTEPLGF